MKKLLLTLLIVIPVMTFAQYDKSDTLAITTDTVMFVTPMTAEYSGHIYFVTDSITGTADATCELVVCDYFDSTRPTTRPADSLFISYGNPSQTLVAGLAYSFKFTDLMNYDYIGLKFTMNSATALYLKSKLKLKTKSSR